MQSLSFYWPFIRLGATDVWRHKTRSFLTMLGMVFGVGSVIAMLAVGEGASHQALESIKRLGSQNIMISSVKPTSEENSTVQQSARLAVYGLLYDDETRIRETVPGVEKTVPARMVRRNARYNERLLELRVVETVPSWFEVVPRPILAGRILREGDMESRANVCVLTEFGVRKLLAAEEVLGQHVRLGSGVFEVVGIVKNESGGSVRAPDSEADAYIPLSTGSHLFGVANSRPISGGVESERVELSQVEIFPDSIERTKVDERLIELAKEHRGMILTNDFNLAKVAATEKIDVININSLAQGLRSEYLPGDKLQVEVISVGSNPHQGIAYLPDGTMVVVDNAERYAGKNQLIEIEFVRYLQTNAGKMMFAKVVESRHKKPTTQSKKQRPAGRKTRKNSH